MCTAIALQSLQGETFFGRTLDFSYDIAPHMYIVPQNYQWNNELNNRTTTNAYRFIGIGQQLEGITAFFDGVNEHGFAAAALYFYGYALYSPPASNSQAEQIVSYDFLTYILGNCESVEDLALQLGRIQIVGLEDPLTQSVAPLHWIAADSTGACIVVELTSSGQRIYDNPLGVLANSPTFPWQVTNLRSYMNASPMQTEEVTWGDIPLSQFGQGGGTVGLPGGFTSPERFVRASYLKTHIPTPETATEAIASCFHIMDSVTVPKGAVITSRDTYDYTKYTAFMDVNTREYFFNTYDNLQIRRASMDEYSTENGTLLDLGSLNQPMMIENMSTSAETE